MEEPSKVFTAACITSIGLVSNLVCALKQCFTGLPERGISELSGSDPWEDRHLISSSCNKSFLFVSSVGGNSFLGGEIVRSHTRVFCLFLGSTSFLPVFLAVH